MPAHKHDGGYTVKEQRGGERAPVRGVRVYSPIMQAGFMVPTTPLGLKELS